MKKFNKKQYFDLIHNNKNCSTYLRKNNSYSVEIFFNELQNSVSFHFTEFIDYTRDFTKHIENIEELNQFIFNYFPYAVKPFEAKNKTIVKYYKKLNKKKPINKRIY